MRASDALMIGSTMLVPIRGLIVDPTHTGGCALGMIIAGSVGLEAMGAGNPLPIPEWMNKTRVTMPCDCWTTGPFYSCPEQSAGMVVTHLFDHHVCSRRDWTIEKIADWLRSIEPTEVDNTVERVADKLLLPLLVVKLEDENFTLEVVGI